MSAALRTVFATGRGLRLFLAQSLIAFGLISAIVQFAGQVFGLVFGNPGLVTVLSIAACVMWGFVATYPRDGAVREFTHPDMRIAVRHGDLLDAEGNILVGFTDTFDTDTRDDIVISTASLQGQLLDRVYGGDRERLDEELARALAEAAPVATLKRTQKTKGKLKRYPIGTVAIVGPPRRRIFCLAYSRMGEDLVARSSVDDLWSSLNRLWDAVERGGRLERLTIPLIGSELARVQALDRENLLKLIILSFVARSRHHRLCRELVIMIRPADQDKVNLLEIRAFLDAL